MLGFHVSKIDPRSVTHRLLTANVLKYWSDEIYQLSGSDFDMAILLRDFLICKCFATHIIIH